MSAIPIITQDVFSDGRPAFVARYPELPSGIVGYADTRDEAVRVLNAARAAYIRHITRASS